MTFKTGDLEEGKFRFTAVNSYDGNNYLTVELLQDGVVYKADAKVRDIDAAATLDILRDLIVLAEVRANRALERAS